MLYHRKPSTHYIFSELVSMVIHVLPPFIIFIYICKDIFFILCRLSKKLLLTRDDGIDLRLFRMSLREYPLIKVCENDKQWNRNLLNVCNACNLLLDEKKNERMFCTVTSSGTRYNTGDIFCRKLY